MLPRRDPSRPPVARSRNRWTFHIARSVGVSRTAGIEATLRTRLRSGARGSVGEPGSRRYKVSVPARISIVTLGVDDLGRSKAFYEALGREIAGAVGDEICWFRTGDSYLGLFDRESLARDAGLRSEPTAEFGGITLAINVGSEGAGRGVRGRRGRRRADPEAGGTNRVGWVLGLLRRSGRTPLGDRLQPKLPRRC